jgi:hypothetical protein
VSAEGEQFHLIDLLSQAEAVCAALSGRPQREWLEWIDERGSLTRIEGGGLNNADAYLFRSTIGIECVFVLTDGGIAFILDNTVASFPKSAGSKPPEASPELPWWKRWTLWSLRR